jgi:hypothetical protein
MTNLTPRRRIAVLCASFAAIVPSLALATRHHIDNPAYFVGGLAAGIGVGLLTVFIARRRGAKC